MLAISSTTTPLFDKVQSLKMRFLALAALFASTTIRASARPGPSRLDGEELWGRADACDGPAMKSTLPFALISRLTC